jgi:hypothetical protein
MTAFQDLCAARKMTSKAVRGAKRPITERSQWMLTATDWRVTLKYQGRTLTTDYFMGSAHNGKPPETHDVLASLISDSYLGRDTFEAFCSELGANRDSRRDFATWKECVATAGKIARFLGDDLAMFEEAANNV